MPQPKDEYFEWPSFKMSDLKQCKREVDWQFDIKCQYQNQEFVKTIYFNNVNLRGFIVQKPCDDVMILKDFSGKVKLSNCSYANVGGIEKGAYCSVDGKLLSATGLPEISAYRITELKNEIPKHVLFKSWEHEVNHFKLYLLGVLKPNLY